MYVWWWVYRYAAVAIDRSNWLTDERIYWPALFGWAGSTDQLVSNEWGPYSSSFKMSGCYDSLFHMSWTTKYLVISYPTGIWELHFRSGELNCTYELKYRPHKYVGYDKSRFSVTPAHMKRAGHLLPVISKERVIHFRSAQKSRSSTPAQLKRAGHPLPLVSKDRKISTSSATLVWAVIDLILILFQIYSN
jgi:hypothetical protein